MLAATQDDLLRRIGEHRSAGRGTDVAADVMTVSVDHYTDHPRLERERQLLRRTPAMVGLSGLIPEPGSYAATNVGDVPVIMTRDEDGNPVALLNACRHRGAPVVEGCGVAERLRCPYHGWTYGLDGSLVGRRRPDYFESVAPDGLIGLPIHEEHGLLWVTADPDSEIDRDPLGGAAEELAPFDLGDYQHFRTVRFDRALNWKLVVETFCEAYHLAVLHRDSLDPLIFSDYALFDAFGAHGRMVATRRSLADMDEAPTGASDHLLEHSTLLWFLVPGTVLIYQQDHVQVYRSRPGANPSEAHLEVSLYMPSDSPRPESHWAQNFDLLVRVTDTEDFALAASIQEGFDAGIQPSVVFGRNEPALQHYHAAVTAMADADSDHGEAIG